MRAVKSHISARPTNAEVNPGIKKKFMQRLSLREDAESNPYSPVLCISLLLIVGLILKFWPTVHLFMGQPR